MAFSRSIWEARVNGSDNNGGGFDVGQSFATDGAATLATSSAPVFTSASYNFQAGDVGAWLFIKSGTNWLPGWYKITAVSNNAATLDAAQAHIVAYDTSWIGYVGNAIGNGCASVASPTTATWGVDYSQQNGAGFTSSTFHIDAVTNTKLTDGSNTIGKNWIGNVINITGGSGFTVQRVVVTTTTGTTATVDKSLGTLNSSGGTGNVGGALASPGLFPSSAGASPGYYIQSGAYSITNATAGVAGGCFAITAQSRLEGYNTYRGDMGTAPVLTASGINTATLISMTTTTAMITRNLTVDGASLSAIRGFDLSGKINEKLIAKNCTNSGIRNNASNAIFVNCHATGCSTAGAAIDPNSGSAQVYFNCTAIGNTVTGFGATTGCQFNFCIAANNTGASSDGFNYAGSNNYFFNCTAYGNGRDGLRGATGFGGNLYVLNCILEGNAGWGINNALSGPFNNCFINYCAFYNNSLGTYTMSTTAGVETAPQGAFNNIIGSASFLSAPGSNNFALNTNSPGGLQLRGAGTPGVNPLVSTTGYIDIGAVQAPFAVLGFSNGMAAYANSITIGTY